MGHAQVIALDEVRASHQRHAVRHQLHAHFDRWLDAVEAQLPEADATLAQVSETIWSLRQLFPLMACESYTTHVGRCLPEQFDEPICRF